MKAASLELPAQYTGSKPGTASPIPSNYYCLYNLGEGPCALFQFQEHPETSEFYLLPEPYKFCFLPES